MKSILRKQWTLPLEKQRSVRVNEEGYSDFTLRILYSYHHKFAAGCIRLLYCKLQKTFRDTSISPDGKYELTLVEIGEPAWPFGAASGRLILNAGNAIISQKDFELHNDGCQIGRDNWKVAWNENHVEVILSGEEQFDEQICLYYDGAITQQLLTDSTEPPQMDKLSSKSVTADMFIAIVRKYTRAKTLTPRMLNELIDHIEVHQAEKIDGVWEQHLVIHYNCVGAIFIPDVL